MNTAEGTYQHILDYEKENGIGDISAPDEEEDPVLSPEDEVFVTKHGNKLPPVPKGKELSPAMINFARGLTKAYRLCYFQFMLFVDNHPFLTTDLLGYCTRRNIDDFFVQIISKRITTAAVNRRYVSALQKYSDYWEERLGFKVESDVVKKALEDAKNCKKNIMLPILCMWMYTNIGLPNIPQLSRSW